MTGSITVLQAAGPLLFEDLGRPGHSGIGVPASGAFDRASQMLAQRLVGNPVNEAALEITLGSVRLRSSETVTAAITGAETQVDLAGNAIAVNEVFSWPAGARLSIGSAARGLRNYLAVRGGFAVAPVLGSASCDVLSGLGPEPLRSGDTVALAHRPAAYPQLGHAPVQWRSPGVLRVSLGPRDAWFVHAAVERLGSAVFTVTPDGNRVGIRLSGPVLQRRLPGELPSEPLQRGAIQVPGNGQPIIMGPDHPTTGGYPVIATVVADDWDSCGQLRPGDEVRFLVSAGG